MERSDRKNVRLRERLDTLRREIGAVEKDIHDLHKAVKNPEKQSAMRRISKAAEEREARVAERPAAPAPSAQPPAAELPVEVPADDGSVPKLSPDQRFASYFVTGSLHSVRPLRTERRIQRNKAIVMVIIAILVAYGVISLLMN